MFARYDVIIVPCLSATSGVRPLRRYIEREIVTSLAMAMVKGQLGDENTVRVYTRWQAAACSSGRLTPKRSNQQRRLLLCCPLPLSLFHASLVSRVALTPASVCSLMVGAVCWFAGRSVLYGCVYN